MNLAELEEHGWATDEVREVFRLAAESGRSTVALADAFGVEAVFELADEIRPDARAGLDALRAEGIEPVLLTGDNRAAALALAGHATMWMAVFADTGTCLIVVANGLRMLRAKSRAEGH